VVTDDPVYRVNNVWLGPEKLTMPFRATYATWGIGIALFFLTFATLRLWFSVSFFTLAWALVVTVVLTRFVASKLTHERGLFPAAVMLAHEIGTPRKKTKPIGGAAAVGTVRINPDRPRSAPQHNRPGPQPHGQPGTPAANPWEAHRA
ncbi:MAG TPA: hypothetical protein VGL02_24350, partial [Streptomyces sp.]